MTRRLWAVINYKHEKGEWIGKIRHTTKHRHVADQKADEIRKAEGWGPSELVVRKVTMEIEANPVTELLLLAENVGQVRDILAEARLTYHDASPATKKKWERAALAREMSLNRAEVRSQVITLDESKLVIGGPALVGPDGRPVQAA